MEKEKVLELLDKFIDRSKGWIDDAESRNDFSDQFYYQGQEAIVKEIKQIITKW